MSDKELNREFRVLYQTLSMHAMLRDRYSRLALLLDIALFATATIFCATTFTCDSLFLMIGITPERGRLVLGIASIVAFFAAIVSLLVDWKGKSARHGDAVQKLSPVLALFRTSRNADGTWMEGKEKELKDAYWASAQNIVPIPDSWFTRLKPKHLRKVELSKMQSKFPGCPNIFLRTVLLARSIKALLTNKPPKADNP